MIRTTNLSPILFLCTAGLFLGACGHEAPDSRGTESTVKARDLAPVEAPDATVTPPVKEPEDPATENQDQVQKPEVELPPAPHPGPWLWITRTSAAIYREAKPNREMKLGYAKRGGQVPILEGKVEGEGCSKGWYKVASGGYICSLVGTTDEKDKDVKFRPSQPNIEDILPYRYARNAKNGTPLYKSIPTKKQTHQYEPYLPAAIAEREALKQEEADDRKQMEEAGLTVESPGAEKQTEPVKPAKKSAESGDLPESPSKISAEDAQTTMPPSHVADVPLWEREEDLHEVTLADLQKDQDDILGQRMMKGFYIAIDKSFSWDGRAWYKTTKGMVTPADRFWQTEGSDFHGIEIDGEEVTLPIGWVYGGKESAPTYSIDLETDKLKQSGSKKKFEAIQLQYSYHRIGKTDYFQMKDGDWIRDSHIRMTTPGKRPVEVKADERWIDIDISEQTLVVFEGDRPIYATLISSGKESKIKDKDHSTPRGQWRVREKHIASTMDGDGTAAGDLPYSIEDVPYIMYFHKSYATHGAFWHRNYGVQMSHGCINLAPLDAKWVFFHSEPKLEQGFHGNWSSDEQPGSMVVVHD